MGFGGEDLGLDGTIILNFILKKQYGAWTLTDGLAEDRDKWVAVVRTVMNIWVL